MINNVLIAKIVGRIISLTILFACSISLGYVSYLLPIWPAHRLGIAFVYATGFALFEAPKIVRIVDKLEKELEEDDR